MIGRVLDIHVQEHRTRWTSPQPIASALAIFDESPWGRISEMSVDLRTSWIEHDRAQAIREVWEHTGINLRWRTGVEASIAHNAINNTVGVYLTREAYEDTPPGALLALIERIAAALPAFTWARAVPDSGPELGVLHGTPAPPLPFVQHAWLQVLHPRGYAGLVDRAALLAAPARVHEMDDDGTIWMQTYDDPFAYDPVDTIARIRTLSMYLHRHVRAHGFARVVTSRPRSELRP